jgi:hypothetical protein
VAGGCADGPCSRSLVRTLKAQRTATLPGAGWGYVVFQFNTSFEQKAAAAETVTTIRERRYVARWRYFIN